MREEVMRQSEGGKDGEAPTGFDVVSPAGPGAGWGSELLVLRLLLL